jgi:purine nucleoside permease
VFAAHSQPRIPVRVVVVAMFEPGADTGDQPANSSIGWSAKSWSCTSVSAWLSRPAEESQWSARRGDRGGHRPRRRDHHTLGNDLHFDLTHAYWLVAGIAGRTGGCVARVGSVGRVGVDGDLAHGIDAREIPADWKTGYIPLRRSVPYEHPRRDQNAGEAYYLNAALVDWAYRLTKDLKLVDTDAMHERRHDLLARQTAQPVGHRLGKYHPEGKGNYVTWAMEDTGTLQAFTFLAKANRVDLKRVLGLRTASNFDQQHPGPRRRASRR